MYHQPHSSPLLHSCLVVANLSKSEALLCETLLFLFFLGLPSSSAVSIPNASRHHLETQQHAGLFPFAFCFNSLLKPQSPSTCGSNYREPLQCYVDGDRLTFISAQLACSCGSWLLAHIFLFWDAFASQPNSWNQREAEGSRLQAACTGGQVLVIWSTWALGRRWPLAFMSLPAKEYRKQMSQSTALAELIILRRLRLPPASPPLCKECKIAVCKKTPFYIYFGLKCCQGN